MATIKSANFVKLAVRFPRAGLYLLLIVFFASYIKPAFAQLEPLGPIYQMFRGPMIWWSIGGLSHNDYQSNIQRGGFAALFGPIYLLGPDKKETLATIYDSTIILWTGEEKLRDPTDPSLDPVKVKADKKYRIKKDVIKRPRNKNWQQLNIAIGYISTIDGGIETSKFKSNAPVNGISIAAFHDVFKIPLEKSAERKKSIEKKKSIEMALGVGAGFFSVSGGSGIANDTPVVFSTETRIAPTLYCIFNYRFFFTGVNYQFLKFSSIKYSPGEFGVLPGDMNALPRELNLNSLHIMLGVRVQKP